MPPLSSAAKPPAEPGIVAPPIEGRSENELMSGGGDLLP